MLNGRKCSNGLRMISDCVVIHLRKRHVSLSLKLQIDVAIVVVVTTVVFAVFWLIFFFLLFSTPVDSFESDNIRRWWETERKKTQLTFKAVNDDAPVRHLYIIELFAGNFLFAELSGARVGVRRLFEYFHCFSLFFLFVLCLFVCLFIEHFAPDDCLFFFS